MAIVRFVLVRLAIFVGAAVGVNVKIVNMIYLSDIRCLTMKSKSNNNNTLQGWAEIIMTDNPTQSEKLEPCPLAHEIVGGVSVAYRSEQRATYVYCEDCGLQISGTTLAVVAERWNSRAPVVAPQGDAANDAPTDHALTAPCVECGGTGNRPSLPAATPTPVVKEAAAKLREWTDPDLPLPETAYVGNCASCGVKETYTYHVPENLWRKVVPEKWWGEIICAGCFHALATPSPSVAREAAEAAEEIRSYVDSLICAPPMRDFERNEIERIINKYFRSPVPAAGGDEECPWTLDDSNDGDFWETGCGEAFRFTDGGPTDNGFTFCYKCSKRISVGRYSDHASDSVGEDRK